MVRTFFRSSVGEFGFIAAGGLFFLVPAMLDDLTTTHLISHYLIGVSMVACVLALLSGRSFLVHNFSSDNLLFWSKTWAFGTISSASASVLCLLEGYAAVWWSAFATISVVTFALLCMPLTINFVVERYLDKDNKPVPF